MSSVGIVASPTPTVPISSDSTTVMSNVLPRSLASDAAAIQPAVPPPAMTTLWTFLCSNCASRSFLPVQLVDDRGAQPLRRCLVEGREGSAPCLGDVRVDRLVGIEDVVIEHASPSLALPGGQVAKR